MRVAVLLYEGTEPIDLATYGVFSMARRIVPAIELFTVAEHAGVVKLANGLKVIADYAYQDAPAADVLIITGGPGWQAQVQNAATLDFLRQRSGAEALAAVCTGGMILAASGLLDGLNATTKREITGAEISPLALLRERHPAITAVDARVVDCGRLLSGGGVTLCIDMALHLLERFHGAGVAEETARILEYTAARAANAARLPDVAARA
jgi:transcriptional regulator GlxA family with amidase domain